MGPLIVLVLGLGIGVWFHIKCRCFWFASAVATVGATVVWGGGCYLLFALTAPSELGRPELMPVLLTMVIALFGVLVAGAVVRALHFRCQKSCCEQKLHFWLQPREELTMAAPLKHFLDSTGAEWVSGTLAGKPVRLVPGDIGAHGIERQLAHRPLALFHGATDSDNKPAYMRAASGATAGSSATRATASECDGVCNVS